MFEPLAQFHMDKTHPYRTNGFYEVSPMIEEVQRIDRAVYSPDGKYLIVLTARETCMWIMAPNKDNKRELEFVACVPFLYPVVDMVFGPSGSDHVIVYATIGSVSVRDMKTGKRVLNARGYEAGISFGHRCTRYLLGCTSVGDIVWAVPDKKVGECPPEPRDLVRCPPMSTAPRSDTECRLFSYMQGPVIEDGDLRCEIVRECIVTPIRVEGHGVVGQWPRAGADEVDVDNLRWVRMAGCPTGVIPVFN